MGNQPIGLEEDEGKEEGEAERGRRRKGSTMLSLADKDRRTNKVSIGVTGENLPSVGFDYEWKMGRDPPDPTRPRVTGSGFGLIGFGP